MNKIFKVIYSKTRHCYVVVSELAKSHCKTAGSHTARNKTALTAAVLLALGAFSFAGMPVAQADESLLNNDFIGANDYYWYYDEKTGEWKTYQYKPTDIFNNRSRHDLPNYQGGGAKLPGAVTAGLYAQAGQQTITIGDRNAGQSKGSVFIGERSGYNNGDNAPAGLKNNYVTSVGFQSDATGWGSIAIGSNATAENSKMDSQVVKEVGNANTSGTVKDDTYGIEENPTIQGASVALGYDAHSKDGNIAIGAYSDATTDLSADTSDKAKAYLTDKTAASYVSVGSSDVKRRIMNVADGAADSDVATIGQLKKMSEKAGVYNEGWGIKIADEKDDNGKVTKKNAISVDRNLGTNLDTTGHVHLDVSETGLVLGTVVNGAPGTDVDLHYGATGDYVVTVGGGANTASGKASVVLGGSGNTASNEAAVSSGGSSNVASGSMAAVYGGFDNEASGTYASIFAGAQNKATKDWSAIGGGMKNSATEQYASVWGGLLNTASATYASVYGGGQNSAIGEYAAIFGGTNNTAGQAATVTGGSANAAQGLYSSIVGGASNTATGFYATALGGRAGNVNGIDSVGILGGSTGENAPLTLAAGYQSVVTDAGVKTTSCTLEEFEKYSEMAAEGKPVTGFWDTRDLDNIKRLDNFATALGYQATADESQTIAFGHDANDVSGYKITWKQRTDGQYNSDGTQNDYTQAPEKIEETHYDTAYYNRLVKAADGIEDHDAVVMEQLKNASDVGSNIKVYKTDENGNVQFDKENKPIEDTSDAAKTKKEAAQKASEDAWAAAIGTGEVTDPTTKSDTNNPETNGSKQLVTGGTVYNALQKQKTDLTDDLSVHAGWGINITNKEDARGKVTKNFVSLSRNLGRDADTKDKAVLKADEDKSALVIGGRVNQGDATGGQTTEKDYGALGQDSVTVGGADNTASGDAAVVVGGLSNTSSAQYSTVVGGSANDAIGNESSVFGGFNNDANGTHATISGGSYNRTYGEAASVFGGSMNNAVGSTSSVFGGSINTANGIWSSVVGGSHNTTLGLSSTAVGGENAIVDGTNSVGIAGGSTKADNALAAGNEATVTVNNGTAIGYQATANKEGTVAFGHDKDDVYYTSTWPQKATEKDGKYYDANNNEITKNQYEALRNADTTFNDYSKNPTITENKYDTASYNRLVKVADGKDDHDVVVMEQLNKAKTELTSDLSVNDGWGIDVADATDPKTGKVTKKNVISLKRNLLGTNTGNEKVTVKTSDTGLILGGFATNDTSLADDPQETYGATGDDAVTVGGGDGLASGKGSVVTGGWCNSASGDQSTVVGGYHNKASGHYSMVSGGYSNEASGADSSVYGGIGNKATGEATTVLGGIGNTASSNGYNLEYSVVGGGENNTASGHASSVWGGANNKADGWNASVYSGLANHASGDIGAVLGGHENYTAGQSATVVGGHGNSALGGESTSIGGKRNATTGAYATALGGRSGLVSGEYSVGILGGSTGKNAAYTLAAGYHSVVTDTGITSSSMTEEQYNEYQTKVLSNKPVSGIVVGDSKNSRSLLDKFATAVGYQATADEAQTISFGHDAGDVSGYKITWNENGEGQFSKGSDANGDEQFVYGNGKEPTIEEIHYDTSYYNRLVKVADGVDDHDVVVMEQLKQYAEKDGSNIGNNLTVAPVYQKDDQNNIKLGTDNKPLVDEEATKKKLAEAQAANKDAWGKALGADTFTAGTATTVTNASTSDQLVTGKTLYDYDAPVAETGKKLNYVSSNNTTGQNLGALDAQVKTNADGISTNTTNITKNAGDIMNLKNLSNITNEGQKVIKNLSKDAVKVEAGDRVTVTPTEDKEAGTITYKVSANNDGTVVAGDQNLVSGDTVNTAINNAITNAGTATDTKLAGKANVDATNIGKNLKGADGNTASTEEITANENAWGTAIGTGKVADPTQSATNDPTQNGSQQLITGGEVYKALHGGLDDVVFGHDGKDGQPGKDGSIGLVGQTGKKGEDGKNTYATTIIKTEKGVDGVDGKNGKDGITRIVYNDTDDPANKHTVATLDDGMKYAGDTGAVANVKLDHQLKLSGTTFDEKDKDKQYKPDDWTSDNIAVISSAADETTGGATMYLKLNKDLNLTDKGSVRFGDKNSSTILDVSGLTIKSTITKEGQTEVVSGPSMTKDGIDGGSKAITNIGSGIEKDKDGNYTDKSKSSAANIGDVQTIVNDAKKKLTDGTNGLNSKANVDASNIGENLKDADGKDASGEEVKKNKDAWASAIGTKTVEKGNHQLVTSDAVATALDKKADKSYVDQELNQKADKTYVDEKLDTKANKSDVYTKDETYSRTEVDSKVTNITKGLDGKAGKDLDNISDKGKTVIHNIAKDAVEVVDGINTKAVKIEEGTDTTPTKYAVNVEGKGKVASGDTGLISGDTLYKEVHVDKDGSYIKGSQSVGQNLSALDTGLKTTSDLIHTNTKGDTIQIGGNSTATKIDVSGKDGKGNTTGRVITGVVSDANDPNSAANVGYVNGLTAANTQQIYRDMNNAYSRLDTNINRAAAGSNALAALHPLDFDPADKASFAVGYGHYHNANAAAVGAFYQPNANTMVNMGISLGNGDPGFNAGVSFKIGKGSTYNGVSKAEMAQTIHDQAAEISTIKANDAAKDKRIDALEKENQEMKKQIQEILARLNG